MHCREHAAEERSWLCLNVALGWNFCINFFLFGGDYMRRKQRNAKFRYEDGILACGRSTGVLISPLPDQGV
jgi:hypothetical protein